MSEAVIPFPGGEMDPALQHACEVERTLLGLLIGSRPRAYDAVAAILEPHHFADSAAGRVYAAIGTLKARGEAADAVALHRYVQGEGLPLMDGLPYLAHLARAASLNPLAEPVAYARLVRDLHAERRLAEECAETLAQLRQRDAETDTAALIARHSAAVDEIAHGLEPERQARTFGEVVADAVDAAVKESAPDAAPPLRTGLADLDRAVRMRAGNMLVLAGRPGMGKSALAATIVLNGARDIERRGEPAEIVVFSLEMAAEEWGERTACMSSAIPYEDVSHRRLSTEMGEELAEAALHLARLPIHIDDRAGATIEQIAGAVRARARRKRPALVVIDYMQLIAVPQIRGDNLNAQVSHVSKNIKRLAKEAGCPVLALSQLSRDVERRANKRPILSDLRDSGSIEQDADIVMFAYRDEYYAVREEPDDSDLDAWAKWNARYQGSKNKAEIDIAKYRAGRAGVTVHLHWNSDRVVFGNLAREAHE